MKVSHEILLPLGIYLFLSECTSWSVVAGVSFHGKYTGCPRRMVNILGGHSIGHSKQKCLYEHVSYSEQFPR